MAAEDARQARLRDAGLREFACRVWTEPVEGDLESWRLSVGNVFAQPNLQPAVRFGSTAFDPVKNRVVVSATIEARTGQHALELMTGWLRLCGERDNTLVLRRVELYPFEDDADRATEIHDEVIEDLRADAEADSADD
jgi:hypothetical protein